MIFEGDRVIDYNWRFKFPGSAQVPFHLLKHSQSFACSAHKFTGCVRFSMPEKNLPAFISERQELLLSIELNREKLGKAEVSNQVSNF